MSGQNTFHNEPVAIIGMACIFPQAPDVRTFWRNILAGVDAISEPAPEWEADRYLKSSRIATSHGGYLKDLYRFDPREFGIMPHSIDGGEPDQFLALRLAREALQDAGYLRDDYDHVDTGIVLGHSTYLHRGQGNFVQHGIILDQMTELLQAVLPTSDEGTWSAARKYLEKKLPQFNADIVPGLVPNAMTGRIANRLNLRGPNYLIDAACSSSLLAVGAAMDELRNRRSRLMLAGGVNASLPPEISMIFTLIGALTNRGRVRPFEEGSDGTLLGEGLGIVVLKMASDALADRDRIYSVIIGFGQASDGKGLGLLAPSVSGEALAMERAYRSCGVDPLTIELVEAHGTGIPLGDKTEIAALKKIFGDRKGTQGSVAIGSVKSMISHCIPAAGIAGLIKGTLALHHKILPPTLCGKINPELGIGSTPLYVNTSARPWISQPERPRRTGINAFGFGGINAHAILEEAPALASRPAELSAWPAELCVFSAESNEALAGKLTGIADLLSNKTLYSATDIAAALWGQDENLSHRLAMVVRDTEDLRQKIGQALSRLNDDPAARWSTRNGINYSRTPIDGRLAFMFPGEGSQYLNMLADLALHFDEVRNWFDFWRGLYAAGPGETRTDIVFPPQSEFTEERREELEKRLHDMDVGSEAVFIGSQAIHALLTSVGVHPDVMVGHSTGESSALVAAGAIAPAGLKQLAESVRELNRVYQHVLAEGKIPTGVLMAVGALPQATVDEQISALGNKVVVAMDNCSNQLVLYGQEDPIAALQESLAAMGGICIPLQFNRGYHTSHFSAMSEAFLHYYERIGLKLPRVPLYSCASADLFPDDVSGVRELASRQWSMKVRFRETILKMHLDGVRYFVEVGPSGNLSSFVNDILVGKDYLSLATDNHRKSSIEQFLSVLSHLYVNRKGLQLRRLFTSRSVIPADPEREMNNARRGMHLANTMPIVHLDTADRAALRELLAQPQTSHDLRQTRDTGPGERRRIEPGGDGRTSGIPDQHMETPKHYAMPEQLVRASAVRPEEYAPFLSAVTEWNERQLMAECRLSLYEDNFLMHHILSGQVSEYDPELLGLSCVPLTVSLEIMAEACVLLAGRIDVTVIENIKVYDWIALDDGELTLEVTAEAIGPRKYKAGLFNVGTLVVSAEFSFETDWRAQRLPALAESRRSRWEGHELYTFGMFHGPIFQNIKRIEAWNDQGIDAELSEVKLEGFFEGNKTPDLVLNPVLLDAIGQLAAYWIAHRSGTDFNCFPTTIERIELYSQCPQNMKGLRLLARQSQPDPGATDMGTTQLWQFECLDSEGNPLFRTVNLTNVYFAVPNAYCRVRIDPLRNWLGRPVRTSGKSEALLWQLPHLPENFCVQSRGIFLRILAHAVLSSEERNEWRALTPNVRHKREWLLGRVCLKEAVRYWILQKTGRLIHSADIIVLHEEKGAPYVDGLWIDDSMRPPEISLSHDRHVSVAAVASPLNPIGVDVEHIGKLQNTDLLQGALTDAERMALRDCGSKVMEERVLRIWCAKEAGAKYLGLGLQGRPEEFEVSFLDDRWNLAEVNHKGDVVSVEIGSERDMIIALAAGHMRRPVRAILST
jgi:acyl transferase domain-containing protein/phosphopantetheinyl transferase